MWPFRKREREPRPQTTAERVKAAAYIEGNHYVLRNSFEPTTSNKPPKPPQRSRVSDPDPESTAEEVKARRDRREFVNGLGRTWKFEFAPLVWATRGPDNKLIACEKTLRDVQDKYCPEPWR